MSKVNAYIGNFGIFVTDEDPSYRNQITKKPIEKEADISDHINQDPVSIRVSFVVNENARDKLDRLEQLRDSKKIYNYQGINRDYKNMAVKGLNTPRNADIKDGFSGSLELQQVRIVEQDTQEVALGVDSVTGNQAQADNKDVAQKRQTQKTNVDPETADGFRSAKVLGGDEVAT